MAYSTRENQSGGNRNFKPRFNNSRPDMHKATCSTCGNICEVPFKPTGSKPVYCNDCFRNNGGSDSRRTESKSFSRSSSDDRQMYDAVCSHCGNACQIPFQPKSGRDIFCSRCFEKNSDSGRSERHSFNKPSFNREDRPQRSSDVPNYKSQFEALNSKMDKILDLLTSTQIVPEQVKATIDPIVEEVTEEKKEKAKTPKASSKKAAKTKKTTSAKKK
jgi:CxxC-x17-CxxC domain-containing protein